MTWTPDTTPAGRTFPLSATDEQFPLMQGEASSDPMPEGAETLRFYVDWNNNLMFDHAYAEITSYVQRWSWSRGRSGPTQYDGAGTLSLNLKNNTSIFSSFNTASPVYGKILPNLRVKITSQIGSGIVEIVAIMRLDSIVPEVGENVMAGTATLSASGCISRFTNGKANLALMENAPTGNHVELILDNYGVHPSERIIDTGMSTISKWWAQKDTPYLDELHGIQDAELGRFREDRKGNHVFDDRAHSYNPPNDIAQATYGPGGLSLWELQQMDHLDGIYNYASANVRTFNKSEDMVLAIICDVVGGQGGAPPVVPGSGSLTINIECPGPSSPTEVVAADSWSTIDIEGNTNAGRTGTDITSDLSYVATQLGQRLQLVITNANASAAYLVMLRAHGVAILEGDPIPIVSQDVTSIAKYGKREYPSISEWITNLEDGQAMLDYVVAVYKDPRPRMQLSVKASNAVHLREMQVRELGDRIHITANLVQTGLAIDNDFIVDNIAHSGTFGNTRSTDHKMVIECTMAPSVQLAKSGTPYDPKVIQIATKDFVLPGVPQALSVEASTYKFVVQWTDPATGNLTLFDSCVQFASDAAFTTDATTRYGLGYVNNYTFSFPLKTRYFRVAMYNESGIASDATTKAAIVAIGGSADYGWGPFCAVSAAVTTAGLLTTDIAADTIIPANMNIALRGWTLTSVFSALDADTVQWGAGTLTAADGTSYSIGAGNTGNMAAITFIYFNIAISATALQVTTTAATAIGAGKVLVAVAQNQTSRATYQVFGGSGGVNILVDNLVANAASVNEFISNTAQIANLIVTNAKIAGMSVDKLTAGTITSKIIELALTPGAGDAAIRLGKTDFGDDAHSGFILGADDSDGDKPKFEIGSSATSYLKYDGTSTSQKGGTFEAGTIRTSPDGSGNYIEISGATIQGKNVSNAEVWTIDPVYGSYYLGDENEFSSTEIQATKTAYGDATYFDTLVATNWEGSGNETAAYSGRIVLDFLPAYTRFVILQVWARDSSSGNATFRAGSVNVTYTGASYVYTWVKKITRYSPPYSADFPSIQINAPVENSSNGHRYVYLHTLSASVYIKAKVVGFIK